MKLHTLITLLAALQQVCGHTLFTTLFVNDVDQGDGTCVRMPMTPGNATFPINDLSSSDMACGRDGMTGVARVCPVGPGAKLSFLFREHANGAATGSIDISHKGPCAVYVKQTISAINSTGIGDGWIKIMHEGYDEESGLWCTDQLIKNDGFLSVNLPMEMAGGAYLVRVEILALHQAEKSPPNPQFYIGCAQIFLQSGVVNNVTETVRIPGHTDISDPSVLFNIYKPRFPYTPPGPPVLPAEKYNVLSETEEIPMQNEGYLPSGAVLVNANWWGMELESYMDEAGCNKAARDCLNQSKICYSSAPPTGSTGCVIWDEKCIVIQENCDAGIWTGPPNQGRDLTPTPAFTYFDIPLAVNGDPNSIPIDPNSAILVYATTRTTFATIVDYYTSAMIAPTKESRTTYSTASTALMSSVASRSTRSRSATATSSTELETEYSIITEFAPAVTIRSTVTITAAADTFVTMSVASNKARADS